jgi:5-methylcytosine-specific restriction enzyme subunit McrC
MLSAPAVIALREWQPHLLPPGALTSEMATAIKALRGSPVAVDRLWDQGDQWRLTSQGRVGYLPITQELHLALQPKAEIGNLFRMLEYAYKVGEFLPDSVHVESLQELYERLARVLAERVTARCRQGLYREYLSRQETLSFVRGRLDLGHHLRTPWSVRPRCEYQEHTPDVGDNQLLAWTLYTVAASKVCGDAVQRLVRQTIRQMGGAVTLEPFDAAACVGRLYHRLNEDYAPMHALCRFFLTNSGPACRIGDWRMVPFLIDMALLFETFVAEWLRRQLLGGLYVDPQHRFTWDAEHGYESRVDVVLRDRYSHTPVCVLDTKYKLDEDPKFADVYQVVAYAVALECREAVLVYPFALASPTDTQIGGIHVRTLGYPLDDDLEPAGQAFLQQLLAGQAG